MKTMAALEEILGMKNMAASEDCTTGQGQEETGEIFDSCADMPIDEQSVPSKRLQYLWI